MKQLVKRLKGYETPEAELFEVRLDRTLLGIYSEQQTGSSGINNLEDEDSWDSINWN